MMQQLIDLSLFSRIYRTSDVIVYTCRLYFIKVKIALGFRNNLDEMIENKGW